MTLPITGSRLVAEDATKYVNDMKRGEKANVAFGDSAKKGSIGANALSVGIGNILSAGVLKVADGLFDISRAGVAAFAGSVRGAAELEAQMSGVAAVMGGTQEELAQLKQLTVDLGIDPTLKVSSVEAAEAIEMLAKNGLDMATIMEGAAKATVALSNATGGDFARSADIMTDAAAIFKFQGNEMINVVAGITAVTNTSKFGLDDYALALANGGDVAAKAGVPFADFNTTISAISPSFSSGMTAGTSFKNFLLRLTPNTDAARDAMRELNLATDDGKSIFFDAQGNLRDMAEIAGILQESLAHLSTEQRQQALRTIFGNDAMGAAIALAEVGRDRFLELGESMAEVDPNAAGATRMDNFAGAMEILDGVIESVSLQVGDKFLSSLTKLARVTADFIDQNADKFIAFFERGAELVDIFADELESGAEPAEALRTALAKVIDQETLNRWDEYVDTAERVVGTLKDLATWASQNGPTVISVLKGIGAALLTFKTITTVAAGVTAFSAAWAAGATAFTAAGGGLAGLVALLGGPVIVVAAAAALAIGGLVAVISDLDQMYQFFNKEIDENFTRLREQSRATGDYSQEAAKLANTLELTTTGFGNLTFQADDTRQQLESLISETGNFDGGLVDLQDSLNGVFGGGVEVNGQYITLNGTFVTTTSKVHELAAANKEAAQRQAEQAVATGALATAQVEQAEQTDVVARAINEAKETAGLLEDGTIDLTTATEDQIAALFAEQEALIAAAEAERMAAEEAERSKEIREDVHRAIGEAIGEQAGLVQGLIQATDELKQAEEELAAAPWDTDLIAKAESARDNVSNAFGAIKESHRQMVLDIFIQQAQLEGGFSESAANIAVSLGLMTREEANLRLEAMRVTEQIGFLSDQLLQTFQEDGQVSRQEAELLAAAVTAIENGSYTADQVLQAFARGGMAQLMEGGQSAGAAIGITIAEIERLPETAETAADVVERAFTDPDWEGVGTGMSGGIAAGITAGIGSISAAAVAAVNAGISAAQTAAQIESPSQLAADEVGLPIADGVSEGIMDGIPGVVDAIGDLFDDGVVAGIIDGVPVVSDAIDDLFEFTSENIADGLSLWTGTVEDGLDGLFDIAGPFSALGSTAIQRMRDTVLDPLEEQAADISGQISNLQQNIADSLGVDFASLSFGDLQRIAQGQSPGADHLAVVSAQQLLRLYESQRDVNEQIRAEQERIAELQQAQQDLRFLEQQLRLVELIEEKGLSTDLLQGLEIGVGADPGAVIDAMTSVIQAIIAAAEEEAGIASPSTVFRAIGENIGSSLGMGIDDSITSVSAEMRRLITGAETAAIMPPATPAQTFSTAVNHNIDQSVNIQIENRSGGAPINDADQLAFIWGGFNA